MEEYKFFEDAKFGKSITHITADLMHIYNFWNVQFKFNVSMDGCNNLTTQAAMSNEDLAREFGCFMQREFLAAIERHEANKKREWDEGEKVVEECKGGGTMTRLKDEKEPEYLPVEGKFERIG